MAAPLSGCWDLNTTQALRCHEGSNSSPTVQQPWDGTPRNCCWDEVALREGGQGLGPPSGCERRPYPAPGTIAGGAVWDPRLALDGRCCPPEALSGISRLHPKSPFLQLPSPQLLTGLLQVLYPKISSCPFQTLLELELQQWYLLRSQVDPVMIALLVRPAGDEQWCTEGLV